MKIKKPEDEKYFKDIVLKDILDEISNEDEIKVSKTVKRKKKKDSRKKLSAKTLIFLAIFILFLLFIIILFRLFSDATSEVTPMPTTKVVSVTTQKVDAQEWKMKEDRADYMKTTSPKMKKVKHTPKKEILNKPIKIKTVKSKPIVKKRTERELAKEALRQQMLN